MLVWAAIALAFLLPLEASLSEGFITLRSVPGVGGSVIARAAAPDGAPQADVEAELAAARAAAAQARAQVELAEARAAAAEAKAELAVAKAGGLSADGEHEGSASSPAVATAIAAEPGPAALASQPVVGYSGNEARPAQLLLSAEGSAFFGLLARLEDTEIFGNRTALDAVLQASLAGLWQFAQAGQAARAGDLKGLPEDIRQDVQEVGMAVTPEDLASALAPRVTQDGARKGGDWRPLAQALGRVRRIDEIIDRVVSWEQIFPDPMERATGMAREEAKVIVLKFFRTASLREAGSWSDAELDAAEGLARRDDKLRRVFTRVEIVRGEVAERFSGAVWLPLLAFAILLFGLYTVFTGCCAAPPVEPSDLQGLPLLKLEK